MILAAEIRSTSCQKQSNSRSLSIHMRAIIMIFSVEGLFILTGLEACSDSSSVQIRSPRQFTWTVDSISDPAQQVFVRDIDGTAPDNVFACFYSGGTHFQKLYRFDGASWTEVNLTQFGDSQTFYSLESIKTFPDGTIVVVGNRFYFVGGNTRDSSFAIVRQNGNWSEIVLPTRLRTLQAVGGSAATDVWLGGVDGVICHYNGTSVVFEQLPFSPPPRATSDPEYGFSNFVGDNANNVYVALNTTNWSFLLHRSASGWSLIDSVAGVQWSLWYSPQKRLFIARYSVDVYDGTSRRAILPSSAYVGYVNGTSEENLLALSWDNKLFHYNGFDWAELNVSQLKWDFHGGLYLTHGAAFIGGSDATKSFLLRGR